MARNFRPFDMILDCEEKYTIDEPMDESSPLFSECR